MNYPLRFPPHAPLFFAHTPIPFPTPSSLALPAQSPPSDPPLTCDALCDTFRLAGGSYPPYPFCILRFTLSSQCYPIPALPPFLHPLTPSSRDTLHPRRPSSLPPVCVCIYYLRTLLLSLRSRPRYDHDPQFICSVCGSDRVWFWRVHVIACSVRSVGMSRLFKLAVVESISCCAGDLDCVKILQSIERNHLRIPMRGPQ
ncbi:hypothetical protein C8Q78DRAFT_291500 [Trametes maxima]|nr:hypothetical protein C8Q78DRAFT_291500 [Trametes maxima]